MFSREIQSLSDSEPNITTIPIEQKSLVIDNQDEKNEPYLHKTFSVESNNNKKNKLLQSSVPIETYKNNATLPKRHNENKAPMSNVPPPNTINNLKLANSNSYLTKSFDQNDYNANTDTNVLNIPKKDNNIDTDSCNSSFELSSSSCSPLLPKAKKNEHLKKNISSTSTISNSSNNEDINQQTCQQPLLQSHPHHDHHQPNKNKNKNKDKKIKHDYESKHKLLEYKYRKEVEKRREAERNMQQLQNYINSKSKIPKNQSSKCTGIFQKLLNINLFNHQKSITNNPQDANNPQTKSLSGINNPSNVNDSYIPNNNIINIDRSRGKLQNQSMNYIFFL